MIDDPKPLPPEILADALQDVVHEDKGRVRAAKSHKSVGLKPCPFCGNAPRVAEAISHYIVCSACSTYGPTGDDNLDAAHKWNTRPESEEVARLRARVAELEQYRNEEHNRFLEWRGIELADTVCQRCEGSGVHLYGSTATWHGGIGGQTCTTAVCSLCWGSGKLQPWPSHRLLK